MTKFSSLMTLPSKAKYSESVVCDAQVYGISGDWLYCSMFSRIFLHRRSLILFSEECFHLVLGVAWILSTCPNTTPFHLDSGESSETFDVALHTHTHTHTGKLCMEDYIALQELIVPIVVGGILAILLLLIFIAYIIAYIRRRRKEGRYKKLSDGTY